jgi:hypothetical protein
MGTPFPWYEYMRMLLSRFPEEIVSKYNLKALATLGFRPPIMYNTFS